MNLGKNIKYLRKKYGLSQTELAEIVSNGVPSTVARWESGDTMPRTGTVDKMAKLFHTTINSLVYDDIEAGENGYKDELSTSEKQLISAYRNLNEEGKEMLDKYVSYLFATFSEEDSKSEVV